MKIDLSRITLLILAVIVVALYCHSTAPDTQSAKRVGQVHILGGFDISTTPVNPDN